MKTKFFNFVLVGFIGAALVISGCSNKKAPPADGNKTASKTDDGKDDAQKSPTADDALRMKMIERQTALSDNDIYFDFDQSALSTDAKALLDKKADYLKKDKDIRITVEGHCDERGSNEYNLGLGERRAASIKKYLETKGCSASMIDSITYGEERQVCMEHNESCWSKNRRGHITVNQ